MMMLVPSASHHIRKDERTGQWDITDCSARLELKATCPLPQGWVLVRGTLLRRGEDFSATLFAERQDATTVAFPIPVSHKGKIFELLYLPDNVTRLLLEPMRSPGKCEIVNLTLSSVGRTRCVVEMWRRIIPVFFKHAAARRHKAGLPISTPFLNLRRAYEIAGRFKTYAPAPLYQWWMDEFETLGEPDRMLMRQQMASWSDPPCFEITIIGGATDRAGVAGTYQSLERQIYQHFRLRSEGVDEGQQPALSGSKLVWSIYVRPGTLLAEHALYLLAREVLKDERISFLYADHDYIGDAGIRQKPSFKPDWSAELLRSTNYIGCAAAIRSDVLAQAGLLSADLDDLDYHDLFLRVTERLTAHSIRHIPALLWHVPLLRGVERSDVRSQGNPVAAHLQRLGIEAVVEQRCIGCYRVRYRLPPSSPLVSLVVPTRDAFVLLSACIESILGKSSYRNFELLVVDNQSSEPQTLAYLEGLSQRPGVRVLRYRLPFNYSAINNFAVAQAAGEVICLLNNDTEVLSPDWLDVMLGHLVQDHVGVVGAKLYYSDGNVQHGGVVVGVGGVANHLHQFAPRGSLGYCRRAVVAQELSAVTGACLMTWRSLYRQLGGLNEQHLPVAFNDVDYCLRVREAGYRVIWTPYAELIHHEALSRGRDLTLERKVRAKREVAYMRSRWAHVLPHDPFYNPNFSYNRPDFSLSHAPIVPTPW